MVVHLLLAATLALAADDSHKGPVGASGPSSLAQRQAVLTEMWQRGVLQADSQNYAAQDEELLARIHLAEAAGAVGYLRAKGPLGSSVVDFKTKEGRRTRLTKAGYERWRLQRSQDALAFFQSKDIGAVEAFKLKDLDGKALFEKDGMLSESGQTVLNRVIANVEAHWVTPTGQVLGNRPPPKRAQ